MCEARLTIAAGWYVLRPPIAQDRLRLNTGVGGVISPDGVKAQIEGSVIQTVSRTLKEEVKFNRSRVNSVDWTTYPILTFPEVPEVEIELIDRPNDPPWGGRRADGRGRPLGRRQRRLRRDRRAHEDGAVHARAGEGGRASPDLAALRLVGLLTVAVVSAGP
jgi:hypothetical protein